MGTRMETSYLNVESFGCESGPLPVCGLGIGLGFGVAAPAHYYADSLQTLAFSARDTEFGRVVVEPLPISLNTYKQYQIHAHPFTYTFPQTGPAATFASAPRIPSAPPPMSSYAPGTPVPTSPVREEESKEKIARPPKKKWIKEYLEEPKSPLPVHITSSGGTSSGGVGVRSHGVLRSHSPLLTPTFLHEHTPVLDFEHSRPRTTSHGLHEVPSPSSINNSNSNSSSTSTISGISGISGLSNSLSINSFNGINPCANGINTPINGISTPINGINTQINGINTPINGLSKPINGINTPINGINTPINGINKPINGILPSFNVITSSMNGITTSINGVTTSINGITPINGINSSIINNNISSNTNGTPRAGTREVHNKLEKNRRAHLKECFELLKRQLPATSDDKKTSNLSILGSAIRYIQVLRRKERECEHEMERLAREKIAAQQRLAALKRDVQTRVAEKPRILEVPLEEKEREEKLNGQILGIPINVSVNGVGAGGVVAAGGQLRALTLHAPQVVRGAYGGRNNTLTLTALSTSESISTTSHKVSENGVSNALSTLVHPAQIHLPISQMMSSSGLVVGGQLLSPALRLIHTTNGVSSNENNRLPIENGVGTTNSTTSSEGAMMGLTPLAVSQPQLLAHTLTHTHKMVETQVMKGSVLPITVSAQYLTATTIMKPVVVVSSSVTPPSTSA